MDTMRNSHFAKTRLPNPPQRADRRPHQSLASFCPARSALTATKNRPGPRAPLRSPFPGNSVIPTAMGIAHLATAPVGSISNFRGRKKRGCRICNFDSPQKSHICGSSRRPSDRCCLKTPSGLKRYRYGHPVPMRLMVIFSEFICVCRSFSE